MCHAIQLQIAKIGLPIYGKTNIVKSNVVVCETICMKAQNYNSHFLYNVTQTIPRFFMIQWMMELFGTYNEITQPILINLDRMCYTEDTPKLYYESCMYR